ncbi:LOW QUALITY PROTEIN: kinesin-like protein KIF20B [Haliotis rubra]|uniref:LOW QUALITY PROTEIN: kinesin-like protein KIF20B n=1 Tax=Haliotis rubra TaxID=36100 RepID=UPI001EE5DEFD|nr:LOW QUALITY PROTEIN: kinesin-like protein KIF20B [Haliotis rubra]
MAGKKRLFSEIMGPPENVSDTRESDVIFEDAKKNLLDTFSKSQTVSADPASDHMKVYLRVRPFSEEEKDKDEDQKCLKMESDNSVVAYAPKDSHTFKNYTHGLGKTNYKFTFSKIFNQDTTQKEFFDETMLGLARDFIDGQNCLVFTYGVTSSGKTYTIQGKPHDAGLLPRALDVLFNSISGKQWPGMDLKPKMFTDVRKLTPEEEEKERRIKEKTLSMSSDDDCNVMTLLGEDASDISQGNTTTASEGSNVSAAADHHKDSVDGDLFAELENRVREEAAINVEDQGQIKFLVWVSFAEIYNEQIFDLLEQIPKKKNARRQVLKLSEDGNGSPYIKGLKEINVTNADEAYKLLTIGQKNLRTACTKLNHNSSRSHCIFNIKILRVVDTKKPHVARVSMLSLCDLAGSERQSKTHSGGDRLKEAGNINTSLMTLGRCIELLRYNQTHKENPRMVPFRDSKLTRLFQNFFSGRGKAAMIVNVNQLASMFDETLNVFKFSAIAKQVVVVQKPDPKPKVPRVHAKKEPAGMRPSIQWASPGTVLKYSSLNTLEVTEDMDEDEELDTSMSQVDELLNIIEHLQQDLHNEKNNKIRHEAKIREEVCKEMMTQLVQIENDYSERIREKDIMAEEMVEQRVKILMAHQPPSKRPRQDKMMDDEDEWVSSMLLHAEQVKVKEKDEEVKKLKSEINRLKTDVLKVSKSQEGVTKERTACEFALADKTRLIQDIKAEKTMAVSQLQTVQNELDITKETVTALQKQLRQSKRESVEYSLQKDLDVAKGTIDELQDQLKQALASSSDVGQSVLLETLSQQLQAAKEIQKKQEHEITELNEMLTEAGETFQQKEAEIAKLKTALAEDEDKISQQADIIEKLQQALEESKQAMEDSELRLQRKNERITTLVDEHSQIQGENDELVRKVEELQALLDSSTSEGDRNESDVSVLLAKKDAEIDTLKARLKREEDDATKRDQALIHGYNAEIASYKAQVTELKAQLRESRGLSPQKSPRKTPKKTPQKKTEDDQSFKNHLLRQIKDLQDELDKNSSAVCELTQALDIARESVTDLEKKLEVESGHHVETKIIVTELKAELKTSLKENEDVMRELTQSSVNVKMEKEELVEEMKEKNENVTQLSSSLEELKTKLQTITEQKDSLSLEKDNLLEVVAAKDSIIVSHVEGKESMVEKVKELETELKQKIEEIEKLEQSVEELEMVNSELKQMLNSSTDQQEKMLVQKLSDKDVEMQNKLAAQRKQLDQKILEKDEEVTQLQDKLSALKKELDQLNTQKEKDAKKIEEMLAVQREELSGIMSQKDLELKSKVDQISDLVAEIEALKNDTTERSVRCQNVEGMMVNLKAEVESRESVIEDLKRKTDSSEKEVSELKEQLQKMTNENEELQSSLQGFKSSQELKDAENNATLLQVRSELDDARQQLGDREKVVKEMEHQTLDIQDAVKAQNEQIRSIKKCLDEKTAETSELEKRLVDAKAALSQKDQEMFSMSETMMSDEEKSKQEIKDMKAKLSDIQAELSTKENELQLVRESYTNMQEQILSNDAKLSQLSEASIDIAELKSALHMEKTLHQKYKDDLHDAEEEQKEMKARLKQSQDDLKVSEKTRAEIETTLQQYRDDLKGAETARAEAETALKEVQADLTGKNSALKETQSALKDAEEKEKEMEGAMKQLQDEVKQSQKGKQTLNEEMKMAEERCQKEKEDFDQLKETLQMCEKNLTAVSLEKNVLEEKMKCTEERNEQLQNELQSATEKCEQLTMELASVQEKVVSLEEEVKRLSSRVVDKCDSVNSLSNTVTSDQTSSDILMELDAERKKNQEMLQLVESMKTEDDLAPGSARRLRKEKIEVECALVNAKYEIKRLKRQLERSQGGSIVLSPTKTTDRDLVKRLEDSENKYEALQNKHAQCVKELSEGQTKVVTLEAEMKDIRCELAEKKQDVQNLSKTLENSSRERTSSSSTASTDSFVHDELQRSQDRERNLRQQLQQASNSMKENIEKISELEEQLTSTQQTLLEAQDTVTMMKREHEKLSREQTTSNELREEIKQLKVDLGRKTEKLEVRSLSLKDLRRGQDAEREKFDVVLRDARANEQVIEQLKVALTEQEETMVAQDKVLNNKDDEIKTLTEELNKMTERYRQMLDQRGDSSRELRDVMKSLTKAEVERDEIKRQVDKLTSEKNQKDIVIRENNHEIKDLERSLAEKRQENVDLKSSVDKEVHKHVEDKKAETSAVIDDLKLKLREKDRDLRKVEKEIQKYEDQLKEMRKNVTDKDHEMEAWREQRDKLVGSLETLMKQQAAEIKQLKQEKQTVNIKDEVLSQMEEKEMKIVELEEKLLNLEHMMTSQNKQSSGNRGRKRSTVASHPDLELLRKQLEQEREDKLELQRQMRLLQKASDQIVADLKCSNNRLQVQVAALQGVPPPPKPPRMDPSFINDNEPTHGHQEMDATPPIAAKAIKKSGRKRAPAQEESPAPEQTPKSKRGRGRPPQIKKEAEAPPTENLMAIAEEEESSRPSRRAKKVAKGKIGDIVTAIANSPVTRSDWEKITRLSSKTLAAAKKFIGTMGDGGEPNTMELEAESSNKKGKRGRRNLYKEEVSAPFACAPFVPPISEKVDVHNVVQRQLRGRRKMSHSTDC